MQVKGHERQRSPALLRVPQGSSYRAVGQILLVDEETSSRWVQQYQEHGLGGLQHDPQGGGEPGQRELSAEQVDALQRLLREEARPGTQVGRGWTNTAVRQLVVERLGVPDSKRGGRKGFAHIGGSYPRGRTLSLRREPADQGRYAVETRAVLEK